MLMAECDVGGNVFPGRISLILHEISLMPHASCGSPEASPNRFCFSAPQPTRCCTRAPNSLCLQPRVAVAVVQSLLLV
jgi:hypothetical protein